MIPTVFSSFSQMITMFSCGQQRKRVDSQKWTSAKEDVTEGDLGLGKIAQLDICTGTAVCSTAGDKASDGNMDTEEGADSYLFCTQLISCIGLVHIYHCKIHPMTPGSTDDDHLTMEDLISYSFQVAKGMEFLSSRKVKLKLSRNLCAHVVIKN